MPSCSIYGCRNNSGIHRSVGYYAFPDRKKNPIKYAKWVACTKLKSFMITNNSRVCGKHFDDGDFRESDVLRRRILTDEKFRNPRLKNTAVPSKFLGHGETPFCDKTLKRYFDSKWELLFLCQNFDTHIKCLVCYESLKVKKYNIQKHYMKKHSLVYNEFEGEERSELLQRLKVECAEFLNNPENKFLPSSKEKREEDCSSYPESKESENEENQDDDLVPSFDSVLQATQDLKEISNKHVLDEYEAFGQLIAAHLKQLSVEDNLELQTTIMQLITTRRIKHIKDQESAARTSEELDLQSEIVPHL